MCKELMSPIEKGVITTYLKINANLKGCNKTPYLDLITEKNKLSNAALEKVVPNIEDLNLPTSILSDTYREAFGGDTKFERMIYSTLLISSFVKQIYNTLVNENMVLCCFDDVVIAKDELEGLKQLFCRIMEFRGFLVIPTDKDIYILNCNKNINVLDLEYVLESTPEDKIKVNMVVSSVIDESLVYSAVLNKLESIPKNIVISDLWVNLKTICNRILDGDNIELPVLWNAGYMTIYLYAYFNCSMLTEERVLGELQEPSNDNLKTLSDMLKSNNVTIDTLIKDLHTCEFLLESFDVQKINIGKKVLSLSIMDTIPIILPNFTENNKVARPRFINDREMKYVLFSIIDTNKQLSKPMEIKRVMFEDFDDSLFESEETFKTKDIDIKESNKSYKSKFNTVKPVAIISKFKVVKPNEDIKIKEEFEDIKLNESVESIADYFTINRYSILAVVILLLTISIRIVTL